MRIAYAAAILATTAFVHPALAADIAGSSRVTSVTVYPSGAEVVRVADAILPAGESTLVLIDLPGELDPQTLRVEGTSDGHIEIGSVDQKFETIPAAESDARRTILEKQIETLQDERSALDQTIADAEYQKTLMQQLATNALNPQGGGAPKSFGATDLGQMLDLVGGKLQVLSKLVLDSRVRQRAIDVRVEELNSAIGELAPAEQQRMVVSVHLATALRASARLSFKYRVANAGWHPVYDARLVSPKGNEKAMIELVRRADVMQSTTESWDNVALTLSTARPLGATAAPGIEPEPVGGRAEGRASNYTRGGDELIARSADAPLATSERKDDGVAQLQAEVEIAGFQALYQIAGQVSIDNTGTAKKVRIATDAIEAALSAQAVPKFDPNAYLTASFTLKGETPLLPGPVMLYRDGVFMGQGALPMLSPGEESRLGFGADDLIKVKRVEVKHVMGEEGLISTSNVESRAFDITVKNLHDFAMPVTIVDQMPYSTLEAVTVETLAGMTPATFTDFEKKRGVLAWAFDAAPTQDITIHHGFEVTSPKTDSQVGMNIN